ncbi:MAG: 30S ribosomal protein S8 [Actinomycetota bacterium]|nr:30S ribosomal protein S8 [Actinomycetota bacterium]MDK1016281.1 30S ribosomal protein S8 [Actinomycetota bacterium]MDK1026037.1 30S ribosomal protein S8 [Actinomycetota bacterium]MDK1037851.1 30S ribosomal protein S8 [Actinomycetota bacterium]MDK1096868.1 30S ribosomal protein S8 [Actinomycetota bacterium]
MNTDPVADMLTRIRNANMALHPETTMPSSKLKEEIARILSEEGFIDSWKTQDAEVGVELVVTMRYDSDRKPVLQGIERVSKPGRRVYKGAMDVARVRGGIGVSVMSTSSGVMTDRDARRRNVGGEVLFKVW